MSEIKVKKHKDSNYVYTDENDKLLFDMASSKKNGCVVGGAKLTYIQEPDNCKEGDNEAPNEMNIEITPDGYFVLKTERWAFDSIEDLLIPIKDIISRFTIASWGNIIEKTEEKYILKT